MNDKYVLIEQQSPINSIIETTFHSTQRIKFTTFDASSKFIIIGVKSGGIYVFTQEPCQFLKLIPSTYGPATIIAISENEENVAIGLATGVVILIKDFTNLNFQQEVFTEHETHRITALKWNGGDLYCGDSAGRVTVITLKNFLTKAIFQSSITSLLNLDSSIVQVDTHSKFLLISTLTRTLLCNTENERFKQIGKKLRDGHFGGCFLNISECYDCGIVPQTRGIFQTIADTEQLSPTHINSQVNIYCARPGARLWQANFQAEVVVTHELKSLLNQEQAQIIQLDLEENAPLKFVALHESKAVDSFQFRQIYRLLNKFVLTFSETGFYIFDPSTGSLLFSSTHLSNIKDVKIVDSYLYVWHDNLRISKLSLLVLEELILKTLLRKQFRFCAQLCIHYFKDIEAILGTSRKIHLISILETKLNNLTDGDLLLEQLTPLFTQLKELASIPKLERLNNGIVTVNNLYSDNLLPESVEKYTNEPELVESKPEKDLFDVFHEQYKINKLYQAVETTDFKNILASKEANELHELLNDFKTRCNDLEECTDWCREVYLKYLSNINVFKLQPDALKFASDSLLLMESDNGFVCKCGFPLPAAHEKQPKYYDLVYRLMDESQDYGIYLKNIPYMHKRIFERIHSTQEVKVKLSLIIQFSDDEIIKSLSKFMNYDVWDDLLKLFVKLRSGLCLNCGKKIDIDGVLQWAKLARLMVQSIKPMNSIKLLQHYSHFIPKGELDQFFYQFCVFSMVSGESNDTLCQVLDAEDVQCQFGESVGGFLRKKYLRGMEYSNQPLPSKSTELNYNCDYCELPLRIPIINEINNAPCGHNYHQICYLYNTSQCYICKSNL